MTSSQKLLELIYDYCAKHKIAKTTFGRKSVNNWRLCELLENGGSITLKTAEKIHQFINKSNPPKNQHKIEDAPNA